MLVLCAECLAFARPVKFYNRFFYLVTMHSLRPRVHKKKNIYIYERKRLKTSIHNFDFLRKKCT